MKEESPKEKLIIFAKSSGFPPNIVENVSKIRAKIMFEGFREEEPVEFDYEEKLLKRWIEMRYVYHSISQKTEPSPLVRLAETIFSSMGKNTILVIGAGIESPAIWDAKILRTMLKFPERARKIAEEEFVKQCIFYGPTESVRKVAELAKKFGWKIYTENWTRYLSYFDSKVYVRYLWRNNISKDQGTLTITFGSEIDTEAQNEYFEYLRKADCVIFVGVSLKEEDIISHGLMILQEKKIPVIYITKMPESSSDKEKEKILPTSLQRLQSVIIILEETQKLFPYMNI